MTMVDNKNGTGVRVLSLGDLSPRTRKVEIVRNGETVFLDGYVEGRRCPGSVKVALAIAADPIRALADDAPHGQREQAYFEYLRDQLLALVKGLEFDEADVLAGDPDEVNKILRELGWRSDETETEDPEAVGEASPSTGGDSSPSSPPATDLVPTPS